VYFHQALTAMVAAVWRDLHARQAQDYKSVCVCVFKGFGVLSPGFGCAVVAAVWHDLHARQAQEYSSVCVCV